MTHYLDTALLDRNNGIKISVIGCGGTGTQVLSGLARLHTTMIELGHPSGLSVTVMDDDRVESHNIGRQLFFPADIGRYKADVMVNRLNMAYGLNWKASAERLSDTKYMRLPDVFIGCVDSKASRRHIAAALNNGCNYPHNCYWLDFGNASGDGQVLLGHCSKTPERRLPLPSELFPELIEGEEDTETPTCSVRASIAKQGLFLNQLVATWGLELLFRLFTKGALDWHGAFINAEQGNVSKLRVDPDAWKRLGYVASA